MKLTSELLGIVGVVLITASYFLLSVGRMDSDKWPYPLINLFGASLIIFSLIHDWNLSAFLMEGSWALISLYGLLKTCKNIFRRPHQPHLPS